MALANRQRRILQTAAAKGGGGLAVPYQPTGTIVCSNNFFPTAAVQFTGPTTCRVPHVASPQGEVTNIRTLDYIGFVDPATMMLSSTGINAAMSFKRYIEYPASVFHQVLWAGVGTITSPTFFSTLESDIVISSVTGLPLIIPAGATFWERTVTLAAGTSGFPTRVLPANSSTIGNGAGKSLGDLGNSGTIAADASVNHFGSTCIKGDVASAVARSWVCAGDSLVWGQGDATSVGVSLDSGWLARAIGADFPYFKIAAGGIYVSALRAVLLGASVTTFLSKLNYTDFVDEGGINDMSLNSRTPAQVLADKQAIWNQVENGHRVWTTTITARSTSSNGYADAAGQTPKTDGTFAQSYALSDTLRGKPSPVFGVIDAGDFDMTARNSGVHDGPFPPTTDGTHFLSPKAADIGAKARIAIQAA